MSVERGNFEETRYLFYIYKTDWDNSNTDKRGQILFDRPICDADAISRVSTSLVELAQNPQLVGFLISNEDLYFDQYEDAYKRNIFVSMLQRGFWFRNQGEDGQNESDYQLFEKKFKQSFGDKSDEGDMGDAGNYQFFETMFRNGADGKSDDSVFYDLRLTTDIEKVLATKYPDALTTALLVSRSLVEHGVDVEMDVIEESKNCVLDFAVNSDIGPIYVKVQFTNSRPESNSLPFKLSLTTQSKWRESNALMN